MDTTTFWFFGSALNFLFGLGGLALIFALFFIVQYNGIISVKNKVAEAFSAIDTVLQNRYNIIPNLVEIVKQYASHEKEILEHVSQMRSELLSNSNKKSQERFDLKWLNFF